MKLKQMIRGRVKVKCYDCGENCWVEWWAASRGTWMEPGHPFEWVGDCSFCVTSPQWDEKEWRKGMEERVEDAMEDEKGDAIDRAIEERKEEKWERFGKRQDE